MKKAVTNQIKAMMKPKKDLREPKDHDNSLSDASKSWQVRKARSVQKLGSRPKQNTKVTGKGSTTRDSRTPKKKISSGEGAGKKDDATVDDGGVGQKKKNSQRRKQSKKQIKEKDLKQFFKLVTATNEKKKKQTKPKDPNRDYLPDKLKAFTKPEEERTYARTKKVTNKGKETPKSTTPVLAVSEETVVILPKNNENNGKLFLKCGNPFWTEVMFDQEEAEKDGIEVEGRLTADHVLKYLEGGLTLLAPPELKFELDWTRELDDMKATDDEQFNEDAIIYHTLRNVINHSERALQRCMTHGNDDSKSRGLDVVVKQSSEKSEDEVSKPKIIFVLDKNENLIYDRANLKASIVRCLRQRRNLALWNEEHHPCGLPPFADDLPVEERAKLTNIWKDYQDGESCDEEQQQTRELLDALPREVRKNLHKRPTPQWLKGVSKETADKFQAIWKEKNIPWEQKHEKIEQLAEQELTGENLKKFQEFKAKKEEERKEREKKVAELSPEAKEAYEKIERLQKEKEQIIGELSDAAREQIFELWHSGSGGRSRGGKHHHRQ